MLRLKDICKSYTTGDFTQKALDGVSVDFRKSEFVAILGPSGCGKTTLLNIVGGLDHYDSGDLEIFGKSTKNFKDGEWDAYRNNSIGFIFQSHNLISHLSLLQNVELGLSLSGVNRKERRKRAIEVLNQVGLSEHIKKKPNQLSGGQSQRVAIARALANNPDIVLADEPTGSLDSVTSVQVMEIIKEISQHKLVVMVTHNQELADKYATRIIRLKDGKIVGDSHPVTGDSEMNTAFSLKKTAMSYWTALVSSLNNIRTKLGRTILTAFAGSIGIIGIALILSLSNGLDEEISSFEADTIAGYPISITSSRIDYDKLRNLAVNNLEKYPDDDFATFYHPVSESSALIPNTITDQYVDWVRDYAAGAGAPYVSGVKYVKYIDMSLLRQNGTSWSRIYSEVKTQTTSPSSTLNQSITGPFFNRLPEGNLLSRSYDLLYGAFPVSDPDNKSFEVVLVVDPYNRIYDNTLSKLGFANIGSEEGQQGTFDFSEIVGREFKLYVGAWSASVDMSPALDIKISGIVRLKKGSTIGLFYNGLGFPAETFEYIYENAPDAVSENIESIYIYANSFEDKDIVKAYLDSYNDYYGYALDSLERIEYVDLAGTFTSMIRGVLDTISIVLVGFAAISLVVSSIMIAIITYISVLERTKEIGVLRALGARKKDVSRVFNSENLIIGLVAGFVGVMIGYALTIPANMIIDYYAGMPDVAELRFIDALFLNIISIVLAFLSGFIPARIAAKKDPVIALRTE
jgi:putative ABC transport system permease protein